MKIKRLEIQNFLVIGKADIALDSRGLVLVQGQNDSDTSANSNGAGKSSIVDAISWCLYGETARDISGDAVVNNVVGKDCFVKVEIQDDANNYVIIRHRKSAKEKNNLYVFYSEPSMPLVDLTKGTAALTQDLINKIVGCSYEVFVAAIYSGQEKMPDLPRMTDKALKTIVEEAAGIERLQAAYEIALVKSKKHQADFASAEYSLDFAEKDLEKLQGEKMWAEAEGVLFEGAKKKEIKECSDSIEKLQAELDAKKAVPSHSSSAIEEEMDEVITRSKSIETTNKAELSRLASEVAKHERLAAEASTKETMEKKRALSLKSELDNVAKRVGTPCSECGKEYHEEDIAEAKANAERNFKESLLSLKQLKALAEDAQNALKIAHSEQENFKATMLSTSELLKRYNVLNAERERIVKEQDAVSKIASDIVTLQSKIENIKEQITSSPYANIVKAKEADITNRTEELKTLSDSLKVIKERLEIANNAVDVFGRAGVRAHILDTVTPFLNERTAEYLGTLTDGNINASWSTLSKTAKGELREKFQIAVSKKVGSETFAGLSGGEKRKVRLSTAMALQDLVASRVSKPIEFQLWDEVDDALDVSGLERLMTILEKKGREKGTVLVISHNDLASYIDQSMTVTNSGGVSTVKEVS